MSFAQLKRNSGAAGLKKLTEEVEKLSSSQNQKENDERFWRPTLDKSGNSRATIRFLPPTDGESIPWVKLFSHAFKGPNGSWYIENSLTTLGQKDPVGDYNSQLWNSGIEANKEIARKQKRKLSFISNILVVKDPANPENEGKVFLFKFGKKIFDKINDVMHPDNTGLEEDDSDFKKSVNPFDLWEGANFKLRVGQVEGYANYDKSEFGVTGAAVEGGDAALEELWKKQYKLEEFIAPSNFKSYDDLKARFEKVIGATPAEFRTVAEQETQPAPVGKTQPEPEGKTESSETSSDDSDDLSFLQGLVD